MKAWNKAIMGHMMLMVEKIEKIMQINLELNWANHSITSSKAANSLIKSI